DLIVGNCGLNNQFHPNEKEPMTMYYKDFDNNGSIDPVLCYYINGVSYPAASRDDITDQLPGLKKKFLAYKDYANATIHDLFTEDQLKDAAVLKAETMQTVYLENLGSKGFAQHNLPIEAQYAPVCAIAAADVNHDGKKDLLLAGNNTWTRIKFGRYSANHGQLFLNNGKGDFKYVPQFESGLNIRSNVRSLKQISAGKNVNFICGINNSEARIIKVK
ncbi:MAG: ASPIC/UnbV domain protein, partial [Segetibacter sp.]|nr:ASPIC/UnbV domain protein [Segetibacter sp.]